MPSDPRGTQFLLRTAYIAPGSPWPPAPEVVRAQLPRGRLRASNRSDRHPIAGAETAIKLTLQLDLSMGPDHSEVSLYRLPENEDRPRVGKWVHLAGTY